MFFPDSGPGVLRSISAVFSILSVVAIFMLGKNFEIENKKTMSVGILAAFLISINAFHIQFAQEFRGYSLFLLTTILSTIFIIKSVEEPKSKYHWQIVYVVVSAISFYSHFFAILLTFSQLITLPILSLFVKDGQFKIKNFLLYYLILGLLISPVIVAAIIKGPSQISWIPALVPATLNNFVVEITGNNGVFLPILYIFSSIVAIAISVRYFIKREFLKFWKLMLVLSSLVTPLIITIVYSLLIKPFFIDRYLIFVMPYFVILSSVGILSLLNRKRNNLNVDFITVSIGLTIFLSISIFSYGGVRHYFNEFKKEDWVNTTKYLRQNCESGLRLYYMPYTEPKATYYDSSLGSQVSDWYELMDKKPQIDEVFNAIPDGYKQSCLVVGQVYSNQCIQQLDIIKSALKKKYSKSKEIEFYQLSVEVYSN
jgi:uncharacterized membrane protein